ncbi:uncharacterized protein [Anser cygnoides]|uniref:uncharacterized protein n=1 Tax=Anser cygnoides TaxID=8845 RepID=UPI0034D24C91
MPNRRVCHYMRHEGPGGGRGRGHRHPAKPPPGESKKKLDIRFSFFFTRFCWVLAQFSSAGAVTAACRAWCLPSRPLPGWVLPQNRGAGPGGCQRGVPLYGPARWWGPRPPLYGPPTPLYGPPAPLYGPPTPLYGPPAPFIWPTTPSVLPRWHTPCWDPSRTPRIAPAVSLWGPSGVRTDPAVGFGVLSSRHRFLLVSWPCPTASGAWSRSGTVAFPRCDWGESCWHGSELGLSVGTVSKVAITKAKVDFSGVVCLPPSVIAGNGLDGGGAGENDDEPVLVSLSAAPSPQSEAVANELQELSLQPELTLSLHHGRNPNLPPLSERKNVMQLEVPGQ